ncbi:Importin subunit alpha-4 [Tulasnella sp. 417]|nr:Importin subunit alpha-4 [Tulasnella sp. 417]
MAELSLHPPSGSVNVEDTAMGSTQDHSSGKESAKDHDEDEKLDSNELDGYITVHNQIAPEIVNALRSNDRAARLDAATKLHRLVKKQQTAANQPIIDSDILRDVVSLISLDDVDLHVHLNAILSSIVAGSSQQTSVAVEMGAIQKFILLASSSTSDKAREMALIALGNIGAETPQLRGKLLGEGAVKPLLEILGNPSKHQGRHKYWAATALENITHSLKPGSNGYEVTWDIIPVLAKYIEYQTMENAGSLEASLSALGHILSTKSTIDTALRTNIVPRLVQLCSAKHVPTRHLALRCVGIILAGSDDGTNRLVDAGIIGAIKPCITSEDGRDRRRSCWAASNIAVGTIRQAEALMEAGFVPLLVKVVSNPEEDHAARGNAAWALASLAYDWGRYRHQILETLLEDNCLDGFLSALVLTDRDVVERLLRSILVFVEVSWGGRQRAIEMLKATERVALLRTFKMRPEPDLVHERIVAHKILRIYLKEFSLPPRV